jgi:membrane protein implicated in regulation of membrane protease activity
VNHHHPFALLAVGISTIAVPTVWLSELDIYMRIILSIAATISAICAARYYWKRTP